MELNPHFLFNALNSVSGLIRRREHDAAIGTLARLGDLLRRTIDRHAPHTVPLRDELSFLRLYLEIEQIRFRDRLTVNERIDPSALDLLVPSLILQPLVENAVRHGIAPTPGEGHILIRAERGADVLRLSVHDTGAGFPVDGNFREGIGLANTRARLAQFNDGRARLDLGTAAGGGALVTVTIPAPAIGRSG
jgi:LytS/YehU family sensor histidine kinase